MHLDGTSGPFKKVQRLSFTTSCSAGGETCTNSLSKWPGKPGQAITCRGLQPEVKITARSSSSGIELLPLADRTTHLTLSLGRPSLRSGWYLASSRQTHPARSPAPAHIDSPKNKPLGGMRCWMLLSWLRVAARLHDLPEEAISGNTSLDDQPWCGHAHTVDHLHPVRCCRRT